MKINFLLIILTFILTIHDSFGLNLKSNRSKLTNEIRNLFDNLPEIETERIFLKKPTYDHAKEIFEFMSDPRIYKYIDYLKPHKSINDTLNYIQTLNLKTYLANASWWAAFYKKNNKLIGLCGLSSIDFIKKSCSVAGLEHPDYWNQGFGTEVLITLIKFANEKLGLSTVTGITLQNNISACKVLEKNNFKSKANFEYHYHLK